MTRIVAVLILPAVIVLAFVSSGSRYSDRQNPDPFKNDSCVRCHSNIAAPAELANHYLDWRVSVHRAKGVGCEKCHGGNPSTDDSKLAHRDLSRLSSHGRLLKADAVPTICGACHHAIATSFVESAHYQKLKPLGFGPTCSSCHGHMASSVPREPQVGEALCTYCHNTENGILPQRPDIPKNARATLEAIQRTENMLQWIGGLLDEAGKRKIPVSRESEDAAAVRASLKDTKVAWHTFEVADVLAKADKNFDLAVDVKDRLKKKLGHD